MRRIAAAARIVQKTHAQTGVKRLLKDYEVEAQYGISKFTLRADRIHGRRFKFIKIGRSIYYRAEDIETTLDAHSIVG